MNSALDVGSGLKPEHGPLLTRGGRTRGGNPSPSNRFVIYDQRSNLPFRFTELSRVRAFKSIKSTLVSSSATHRVLIHFDGVEAPHLVIGKRDTAISRGCTRDFKPQSDAQLVTHVWSSQEMNGVAWSLPDGRMDPLYRITAKINQQIQNLETQVNCCGTTHGIVDLLTSLLDLLFAPRDLRRPQINCVEGPVNKR